MFTLAKPIGKYNIFFNILGKIAISDLQNSMGKLVEHKEWISVDDFNAVTAHAMALRNWVTKISVFLLWNTDFDA